MPANTFSDYLKYKSFDKSEAAAHVFDRMLF